MTTILMIRTELQNLYGRYEKIINPLVRGVFAFVVLMVINAKIGYMTRLDNFFIVLLVSVLCGALPMGFTAFVCALFSVAHVSALSIEVAGVWLAVLLCMFLLYFRLCGSRQYVIWLLTPLAFLLKIPYVMPLVVGVAGGMGSAIAVSLGVATYYYVSYLSQNASVITAISDNNSLEKISVAIEGIVSNEEMWVMTVIFLLVGVVVYLICKTAMDYAWMIAVISGALLNAILNILAVLSFEVEISLVELLVGSFVSALIAMVVTFLLRGLDYSRAEKVQFEDDEYYYYVKAVPKMQVPTTSRTVKRMNSPRNRRS
ncbi:MAG: hypothetical protein LUC90_08575 [Lachnospiraceae bacterium]|nr:hypothetical protein [Lachnospiraceae bacterium]